MIIGRVIGTVVATKKEEKLIGSKLQLVQPINAYDPQKTEGSPLVAVDAVGAGRGELVVVVAGSSARLSSRTAGQPVDSAIIGIIDSIEVRGENIYHASEG